MAHELENATDMMYVGDVPWHRLGVKLPRLATAQEALTAANMDWNVITEPVLTKGGKRLKDRLLTVREDTGEPLGVVSERYEICNNRTMFAFADKLTQDPNGPKYETAGQLWGGKRVWMLARLDGLEEILPDDAVGKYLMFAAGHDGRMAYHVGFTPVRIVCANTLNMALHDKKGIIKVRHTANIMTKLDDVATTLGIVREKFDETFEVYRALAKKEPTKEQVMEVLTNLFPSTKREGRAMLQRDRVLELATAGIGNEAKSFTAWHLYQGLTELVDHHNGKTSKRIDRDDYRLNSAWFGLGNNLKAKGLQTIIDVVGLR